LHSLKCSGVNALGWGMCVRSFALDSEGREIIRPSAGYDA
jgi:hypothetical protein